MSPLSLAASHKESRLGVSPISQVGRLHNREERRLPGVHSIVKTGWVCLSYSPPLMLSVSSHVWAERGMLGVGFQMY